MIIENEPTGDIIMNALIGPCLEHFEIRAEDVVGGASRPEHYTYHYWVHGRRVPREVFVDAMAIARADQFDPLHGEAFEERSAAVRDHRRDDSGDAS